MKNSKLLLQSAMAAVLLGATATSSGVVVMLSDTVAPGPDGVLETFLRTSFNNVTEIRHGNYALFSAQAAQDALTGSGAFAGMGAADVVIIGRTLGSGDYDNFDSAGYNTLTIPVVSLTSYVVRQDGDRLGWHASGATGDKSVVGDETTVTAAGASILGLAPGAYDFNTSPSATDNTFNGLGAGTTAYGGGTILATIGGDTLAAYWPAGSAPGNPTAATVETFPGARLLFNLDNDPNPATAHGARDLENITPAGEQALVNAIDFATPLTVPEPSSALLMLTGLGLLGRRRRRE